MQRKRTIAKVITTIIMALLGIFFLLPFVWMLSASFKPEADVFKYPIQWIPEVWNAKENYQEVWSGNHPFALFYLNTIKVTVLTVLTSVTVSSLAAYGFAKVKFQGKNALFFIVLCTYMIPPQSILVPQFILYRQLDLYDTHLGLILLNSFSVLGTFLLRQFFMGVNDEYMEAARMDGAGHFKIFTKVMLPIVRPAIATYAVLRFIWTWNDYQNPLIFLKTEQLFTLQLGLTKFADAYGQFTSLVMAGAVSGIVPLLIVFVLGQKHVIEGIAHGGVKG